MTHNSGHAQSVESILPEEVQERLDEVREDIEELDVRIRRTVAEHPFLTLFGALTGGYLLGRLIARR